MTVVAIAAILPAVLCGFVAHVVIWRAPRRDATKTRECWWIRLTWIALMVFMLLLLISFLLFGW
jgi:hypothetical protein